MRIFVFCAALFLATPAWATDWELFARMGSRQLEDPGIALFSPTRGIFRLEVGAGHTITRHLSFELATAISGASAPVFEELGSASLTLASLQGNGVARLPLLSWLGLFGKAGMSVDLAFAHLSGGDESIQQTTFVPSVIGGGGVEVLLKNPSVGTGGGYVSFTLEGDYGHSLGVARFDGVSTHRREGRTLPAGRVDVGSLDLSGWIVQVGATIHF